MKAREEILKMLSEIKPALHLDHTTDIIDGGYLDSLELMSLISMMMETFGIELDIDLITPENFNSVDAMVSMVEQIKR